MGKHNERGRSWTIVLAGGDGVRMREYVRRWSGAETPKQYCAFVGTRSLFQHTLDRAASLTPWERIVIVAGRRHQEEVWKQLEHRAPGMTLLQPANRDTAAGIFFALSYVLARDPEARVAVFPSDHFVFPEDRFVEHVRQALEASERLLGRPIVLAATPKSRELEYGWIQPGREFALSGTRGVRAIQSFVEKPSAAQADMMRAAGGLWNTTVVAAKAAVLWKLGERTVNMMQQFGLLRAAIDQPQELQVLDAVYTALPKRNFFSHVLARVPERLGVLEMRDVLWSDWDHPEQVDRTLREAGLRTMAADVNLPALQAG